MFAGRIFDWLAIAKRPLTLEELREALAIEPLQPRINVAYLVNDMMQALTCCGCLIVVDEEQETVHFTHHSIRHYLLQDPSDPLLAACHVNSETADSKAGEICITYLSFGVFDHRIAKLSPQGTQLIDTPAAIVRQMVRHRKATNKILALAFPRDRETLNGAVQRQLENITSKAQQHYSFLGYARKWWFLHSKRLEPGSTQLWEMWCRLLTDWNTEADKPWQSQEWSDSGASEPVREWAIENNHTALSIYLLIADMSANKLNPRTLVHTVPYLVQLVRRRQWEHLYKLLLFVSDNSEIDTLRTELLIPAAWFKRLDLIQLCVTNLADVHRTHGRATLDRFGMTLKPLSNKGLGDVHFKVMNEQPMLDSWSPIGIAAAAGNIDIIDYIMSRPHPSERFRASSSLPQALLVAAAYDQAEVVRHLLSLEEWITFYSSADDKRGSSKLVQRHFHYDLRDNTHQKPLDYLIAWERWELIELLRQRTARKSVWS